MWFQAVNARIYLDQNVVKSAGKSQVDNPVPGSLCNNYNEAARMSLNK